MDIGIRSRLTTGFAAASVGVLVMSPLPPGEEPTAPTWSGQHAVTLTSATQLLQEPLPQAATPAALPAALPLNPLNPLIQQVDFHVAFLTNFVTTGAVLFGQELVIPGALLRDVHNGTPITTALGSALQTFARIELVAGRDLVGFAVQYVSFQLNFLTGLASMATMPFAAATQSHTRQAAVQLSNAPLTTIKSSVSVGSTQRDTTNRRRPDMTHSRSSASTAGLAKHGPRHDHDGHPKGGGRG